MLFWIAILGLSGVIQARCQNAQQLDAKQMVQQAVETELAANKDDHSRWLYFEVDHKAEKSVTQWVAETGQGDLHRVLEENGRGLSEAQQRKKMDSFIQDTDAQAQQRKSAHHDDEQAAELLQLLPKAFVWTDAGAKEDTQLLHFKPDPGFHPPNRESRVFAAMEGEMAVDKEQHRIMSLKGKLVRDVKFGGGLLGDLKAGGSFDVERRKTGENEWQITETHVHINGHALLFKSISENEDDVKSKFKQIEGDLPLQKAEEDLLQAKD